MKNFKSLLMIAITLLATLGLQAQRQGGADLDPNVKGMNVTYIEYNGGSFEQTADRKWSEFGASGNNTNNFDETHRDEWSVYMIDNSRGGMKIALDLWQKTVKVDGNPIYDITKVSAANTPEKITGWNVQSIVYEGDGSFASIGDGKWGEFRASGEQAFTFDEIGRDEWSVYMVDHSRGGMKISLDLWQKKVKINGTPYYTITDASTQGKILTAPPNPDSDESEFKPIDPDITTAMVHVVYPRTAAEVADGCEFRMQDGLTYIKLDGSSDFLGMSGKLSKEQHYDADGFCDCLTSFGKSEQADEFVKCIDEHRYRASLNYPDNTVRALRQCSKFDGIPIIESNKVFNILDFKFDEGNSDVCGMKEKLLAGQYGTYKNEGVCECLNLHCGESEKPDDFIKCIAEYKIEE